MQCNRAQRARSENCDRQPNQNRQKAFHDGSPGASAALSPKFCSRGIVCECRRSVNRDDLFLECGSLATAFAVYAMQYSIGSRRLCG